MLFHSYTYACLLLLTILVSLCLRPNQRWWVLMTSSVVFYLSWRADYLLLLLLTAVSCHYAARWIAAAHSQALGGLARVTLASAITLNLGVLAAFKYYGFFSESLKIATGAGLPLFDVLLPIGISFYTFQAMGYVIDVYRGRMRAEPFLPRTLLFVSFFPQLVAGPIERASNLLPALAKPIHFRWRNFRTGAWLFLWGLFKKIVIADRLALLVDATYADPEGASGGMLLLATYAFAFQIYCDFSGYTDMAIGSAKIFGIDLMTNFRLPYLASGIREFWSRWHISLSTWFRDYVYIPLGGNRCSGLRRSMNLITVFALSGLWHGAGWNFVVWGLIHGFLIIAELAVHSKWQERFSGTSAASLRSRWAKGIGCLVTFHLILLTWVFFRSDSLAQSWCVLGRIIEDPIPTLDLPATFSRFELAVSMLALGWMHLLEVPCGGNTRYVLSWRPRWKCRLAVLLTVLLVLNFGIFNSPLQFVYFQF